MRHEAWYSRWSRAVSAGVVASVLFVSGCTGLARDFFGIYDGPPPSTLPLSSERVIVRTVIRDPRPGTNAPVLAYHMDRVRFIEQGELKSVDRLVDIRPREIRDQVDALGIQIGDTLIISTRYEGITQSGPAPSTVPDWGGYKYLEYPIGAHVLTAVARPSR